MFRTIASVARMVLLTMNTSVVEAIKAIQPMNNDGDQLRRDGEPSLEEPAVGNPIAHGQVVEVWKRLRDAGNAEYSLEALLRGAKVYVPPPKPKQAKVRDRPR